MTAIRSGSEYTRETFRQAWGEYMRTMQELGFSAEFAKLIAGELGSEKTIRRMTSWLRYTRPRSMEMVADEMLAISADREKWKQKIENEESNRRLNEWLNSDLRGADDEE